MFLRMPSSYISWHMKQALAPILFYDNDKPPATAKRADPVAAAQRSDTALAEAARKTHRRRHPCAQFHQPARQPGHHLRQPDSAGRQHANVHHHHPLHPAATPSLRTTRRHTPPRLRVVTNPQQTNRKTRANTQQRQPNRRNFGLAGIDTVVAEPGGAVEQHLGLLPLLRRVAVEPPAGGPLVQRSPNGDRRGRP